MKGTMMPTTRAMRVRPPKMTSAVSAAAAAPVTAGSRPKVVFTERLIVLACTELKMRP